MPRWYKGSKYHQRWTVEKERNTGLETELEAKEKKIVKLREALAGQQGSLGGSLETVQKEKNELLNEQKEKETAEANIQTPSILEAQEKHTSNLKDQIAQLQSNVEDKDKVITECNKTIKNLETKLTDKQSSINRLKTLVEEQEILVGEKQNQIIDLEASLQNKNTALAVAEVEINKMHHEVIDSEASFNNLVDALKESADLLGNRDVIMVGLEATLNKKKTSITDKQIQNQVKTIKYEITKRDVIISALVSYLKDKEKIIVRMEENLLALDNTNSQ